MTASPPALHWGGQPLLLLAGKAVFLPERSMLLVADLHIGKARSFRQLGVPVPEGTTGDSLDRLSSLLEHTAATELTVLGDFLHSARAHAAATQAALQRWRVRHARVRMRLVRGNHDDHAGDPPAALGFEVVDEPWLLPMPPPAAEEPGLALCHHPQRVPGQQVLAGHLHPCVRLSGPARSILRLPCFHFRRGLGVLPAFGGFTGMHPIRREPGDRVYAVADDLVLALEASRDDRAPDASEVGSAGRSP